MKQKRNLISEIVAIYFAYDETHKFSTHIPQFTAVSVNFHPLAAVSYGARERVGSENV